MSTISEAAPAMTMPESEPAPRIAALERTSVLLALLAAFGLTVLAFSFLTVHRRTPQELDTNMLSMRTHLRITYWLEHGYFASCGLMALRLPDGSGALYSSSTGAMLISGYVLEKTYIAIAGHPSWKLLALHNESIELLGAMLL